MLKNTYPVGGVKADDAKLVKLAGAFKQNTVSQKVTGLLLQEHIT